MKLAAAMLVIAACGSGSGEGGAGASGSAAATSRKPDAVDAAKKCAHAYASLADVAPDQRQRALALGCADLIVEKRCRDAWLAGDPDPDRVARECAAAYCPLLAAPKPSLCGDPTGGRFEFWRAVHLFDLGAEATAILDDARDNGGGDSQPEKLPSQEVRWRIPIVTITADSVALSWRPPHGDEQIALRIPIAQWACGPLQAALATEVAKQWATKVRPTRSKQLLISAASDALDPIVFSVTDCARAQPAGPELYPDVTLTPE